MKERDAFQADFRSKKAVENLKCRCEIDCFKVAQLTKNLQDLIQFSLIEQEALDKAGTIKRYRVSPFVDQYIQNKMNSCMKKDSLNVVCMLLKTKLIECKKAFASNIVKCKSPDEVEKVETEL